MDALRAFAAVKQKYAVTGGHLDVGTVDVLLDLIGSGGDADGLAEFQCALACGAEMCIRDRCTGLRMGELLALKWEDIDFSTAQLHVRRTINRLAKYEAHDGENKTEIVFLSLIHI